MLTKNNGTAINTAPAGLTTRLADVYHKPGDKISDFMAEIKALTDDDRTDFKRWFTEAGYPIS